MAGLVAYGDSDDDSDINEGSDDKESVSQATATPSSSLLLNLPPSIQRMNVNQSRQPEAALENIVQRRQWEIDEAPKPASSTSKSRRVIKISVPELPDDDSDDDDSGQAKAQTAEQKQHSNDKSCRLLSMLSAPKNKPLQKKLSTTSFTPRSAAAPPAPSSRTKHSVAPSSSANEIPDAEEDFFGLASSNDNITFDQSSATGWTDAYAHPQEEPVQYQHPSQMYNLANHSASTSAAVDDDEPVTKRCKMISDDRALKLIRKFETDFPVSTNPDDVQFVEVNVDEQLGDVKQNLVREITSRPLDAMVAAAQGEDSKGDKKPDQQAKRKNQITYLAYVAKSREEALKNEWAKNRLTKKQTQAKYGF